ncbi:MAG: PIN domain-containing protein [Nitrospiria bacterium]
MLCIDTSSFIAYLQGDKGKDVELIDEALSDEIGVLSPVTVTELLSDFQLDPFIKKIVLELPILPVTEGYWERAGSLRANILQQGYKARLADTLIAQNCLDHRALLITRDKDFKIYKEIAGLRLAQAP